MLTVRQITSPRDLERFLRLPWSLYASDPQWVPPLLAEVRSRFNVRKNPYFQHAKAAFFLAERDGQPVGRITAQVCELTQVHQRAGDGHFGFFECEASQATCDALLAAAGSWLVEQGMTRMIGPYSFSIYDEAGLLVEGFHRQPSVFMGHHLPYYSQLLTTAGLIPEMDLLAFYFDIRRAFPERVMRILDATARQTHIRLRTLDKRFLLRDLGTLLEIFNESWAGNWGHVPMTDAELQQLATLVRHLFTLDAVILAEVDDQVAGFIVVLPNLNELIRDLDGKLLPFGWIRLLYRLKSSQFTTVRIPLMGVRKQFHNTRTGAAMVFSLINRCRQLRAANHVTHCEMSWILENNKSMRSILEVLEIPSDKTYRVYSKALP